MRSDLVFAARLRVNNPFLLCHMLRVSSRSLHQSGVAMQDTINKVLVMLSEQDGSATGENANAMLQEIAAQNLAKGAIAAVAV